MTVAPNPPLDSHVPMRTEPGQPVAITACVVDAATVIVTAVPPRDVENVKVVAAGVVKTKYGTPVVMPVNEFPDDVKQKRLPTVKGCASAIVTVVPVTVVASARPVTSGPEPIPPFVAAPRFPELRTMKDVVEIILATTHGALYVALYVEAAHEPVGAAADVQGLGHVYVVLYVNVVASGVVQT